MSWFQSTNFASLAKTALKEAQKTIDKALEINEAGGPGSDASSLTSSTASEKVAAVTEAATDFFASWGVGVTGKKNKSANDEGVIDKDKTLEEEEEGSIDHNSEDDIPTPVTLNQTVVTTQDQVLMSPHSELEIDCSPVPSCPQGSGHHQRSLSDTVFHLTTDLHEAVEVLDAPLSASLIDSLDNYLVTSASSSSRTSSLQVTTNSNSSSIERSTDFENVMIQQHPQSSIVVEEADSEKSKINSADCDAVLREEPVVGEALSIVDLNSTSETDENIDSHSAGQITSLADAVGDQVDASKSTWSWDDDAFGETRMVSIFPPQLSDNPVTQPFLESVGDEDFSVRKSENHSGAVLVDNSQMSTRTDQPSSLLLPKSFPDDNNEEDVVQPQVLSQSDESGLESSSGTLVEYSSSGVDSSGLQEFSSGVKTPEEETTELDQSNDDQTRIPSPPANLISVIDSPRSSSPSALILNNETYEESHRRDSPDTNYDLLSHTSKPSCHSEFLPESSRSSSIVVISTRASSGGSGSASGESTGSDMHRDIIDSDPCQDSHHSRTYEKVELPSPTQSSDPTSPEFKYKTSHRKGPSSASSSDIEVILASEYTRPEPDAISSEGSKMATGIMCMSSIHQQTSVDMQDAEVQTDSVLMSELVADEIPQKVVHEVSEILEEKDLMIQQLREEGEKLSKKQFELSQVIKKLRTKEKELETAVKTLKGEVAGKKVENDRLTKSFVNKESTAKTLSDTIEKLTSEKHVLELKVHQIQSELEDAKENSASMKASVEDASIEILELKNAISTAQRDSSEIDSLTRDKSLLLSRNEVLQKDVEDLRSTVSSYQEKSAAKERELQGQVSALTRKVHNLENQLADASTEVADVTMPLSLQIEKLQTELTQSQLNYERRESLLQNNLHELEMKMKGVLEKEQLLKEQLFESNSTVTSLESKLQDVEAENRNLKRESTVRAESEQKSSQEKTQKISKLERQVEKLSTEVERLNQENESMGIELKSEKVALEHERKRSQNLEQGSISSRALSSQTIKNTNQSNMNANYLPKSGENSPSSHSIVSETSYLDEVFDPHGQINHRNTTPRSFFDSFSSTGLLEHLQNQLRQRDAEVLQFQDEVSKNEKIRKSLNEEIARLTIKNHEVEVEVERLGELQTKSAELETNYNALLQLYGEKVEEADELRMDLQDVKDMYKIQIEQLLKR